MRVATLLTLVGSAAAACSYLPDLTAVFSDQHDGDKKQVSIRGGNMIIKPSGNNQSWTIRAQIADDCSAVVDFNVSGKPNPPPVKLTMVVWMALTPAGRSAKSKATFEFFDPSGKIGSPDLPLNTWVQLTSQDDKPGAGCPNDLDAIFADQHDGDKKSVQIKGGSMTIKPSGNAENWVVNAKVDTDACTAVVDFNVPGKPNPPPVKLTASLWNLFTAFGAITHFSEKVEFEFTDPSGKLAKADYPLNTWVQLPKSKALMV
jgi:hypothetical protein